MDVSNCLQSASTLLSLGPRFLILLYCYLYSFLFKVSLFYSTLKFTQIGVYDLQMFANGAFSSFLAIGFKRCEVQAKTV